MKGSPVVDTATAMGFWLTGESPDSEDDWKTLTFQYILLYFTLNNWIKYNNLAKKRTDLCLKFPCIYIYYWSTYEVLF